MKIAFFGDLHFPYSKGLNNTLLKARDELYFSFFEKVFSLECDIFISLGDLVQDGYKEEMEEVYTNIKKYNKTFYHVLGNHDTTHFELHELIDNRFRFGDTFLNFDLCSIVLLESSRCKDRQNYGGFLSEKQLAWLEECITKSEQKPLFIFSHHPVFDTVRKSNYKMFCIDEQCGLYSLLTKKKEKSFFMNGHNHSDSIVQKDNWTFISSNCIIDARAVKIFDIQVEDVKYQTIDFSTSKDNQLADILVKNIKNINFSKYGVGSTLEKNGYFRL